MGVSMFNLIKLSLVVSVVFLGGCATKYQNMGFTGGVEAQQITSDKYRIIARGNGYTSSTTIQDYVLLKAAETTRSVGGTHFGVISAADATSVSFGQTAGTAQTSIIGRTAFTTYTPSATYSIVKPGQDTYIQVLKIKPTETVPQGALSADEIIKFIGSRVQRGES